MSQQIGPGRAEKEEASVLPFAAAPAVDDASQALEDFRHAMDLIEDHQLILMVGKILLGIGELGPIVR